MTEPSTEARQAAIDALQGDIWEQGEIPTLADAINAVALALDRFAAARVREERIRCLAIAGQSKYRKDVDGIRAAIMRGDTPP